MCTHAVNGAGLTWNTTYVAPSIWVDPFPAASVVEAQLPPLGGPPDDCAFREILVNGAQVHSTSNYPECRISLTEAAHAPVDCEGH